MPYGGLTINSLPDWIKNYLQGPLQPIDGTPVNPAYQQMPDAQAPITDLRGAGPNTWASRPHDQNAQSRDLGGYIDLSEPMGGGAYQWRKAHGYNSDLPTTMLADPDTIPTDPGILARIKDRLNGKYPPSW